MALLRQRLSQIEMYPTMAMVQESCFSRVDKWLEANGAETFLNVVLGASAKARKLRGEEYRSPLDMLFCTLYPNREQECYNCYVSNGKKLDKLVSKTQLSTYDDVVLFALMHMQDQKGNISWKDLIRYVKRQCEL